MATAEELLQAVDDVISDGARRGLLHLRAEDVVLAGRAIMVHGRRLINFGSCSYLGLETHPALKAGVADAVERYGTQFSSSRAFISSPAYKEISSPAYKEAEEALAALFGRPTVITPSTTMGHIAAMPTLIGCRDALLLDHQVHHSVQTAAKLVRAQGSTVDILPHNDLGRLERRIEELGRTHRRIWYAADGLYSMYADFLPAAGLAELVARHEQLWLYVDDAHSVSWTGPHGRGFALQQLGADTLRRTVVAGSLNKSFAAAGGAVTFPEEEMRRRVFTVGGPLIFSGPVQPPMLGAVLASARLHLSDQVVPRQRRLLTLIHLFNTLAADAGLPLVSPSTAPIRCVGAGTPNIAYRLTERLAAAGHYVNTAVFPAVSARRGGARVTLTAHHTEDDVRSMVEAFSDELPAVLADEGSSVADLERAFAGQLSGRPVRLRPVATAPASARSRRSGRLRLERHTSVATVDPAEWDTLLGARGVFDCNGLRALEAAFAGDPRRPVAPENAWRFHYWLVRDDATGGRPVAATFFTTALWKDDMLSASQVSAEVERRREAAADPYYLTSIMVAMGSLLTEGDHLYLDRGADWKGALRLVLQAARAEEDAVDAAAVVLRELPDGDVELQEFLLGEGFLRVPMLDTWVRDVDFTSDEEFLAGLRKKQRQHQRARVLPWESAYQVDVIPGGAPWPRPTSAELDHLYRLYRNVHARGLDLNVFPLPRHLLDTILATPGWELIVLRLVDGPAEPVAFTAAHVTSAHVAPVFAGLNYDHVATHHSYQQLLWQALRSARRRGSARVLFGMSADLHKARFGARPEKRWVYIQPTETFNMDTLAQLSEAAVRRETAA